MILAHVSEEAAILKDDAHHFLGNLNYDRIHSDKLAPPGTDHGATINAQWPMGRFLPKQQQWHVLIYGIGLSHNRLDFHFLSNLALLTFSDSESIMLAGLAKKTLS